jgi:hypothetical protein
MQEKGQHRDENILLKPAKWLKTLTTLDIHSRVLCLFTFNGEMAERSKAPD